MKSVWNIEHGVSKGIPGETLGAATRAASIKVAPKVKRMATAYPDQPARSRVFRNGALSTHSEKDPRYYRSAVDSDIKASPRKKKTTIKALAGASAGSAAVGSGVTYASTRRKS